MLNKFLKGIIAIVLLSMLALAFLGLTNKSDTITTETQIEASPEIVYSYLIDETRAEDWLIDLKSIEQVRGEGLAVGTEYKLIFSSGKEEMEVRERITALEENRRLAFDLSNEFFAGNVDVSLSANDSGTMLTEVNTYSGNNFISRAMLGLSKGTMKKATVETYENLKELIEQEN